MRMASKLQLRSADLIKHQPRRNCEIERVELSGHRNFDELRARSRRLAGETRTFPAHNDQLRFAIERPEILSRREMRTDDIPSPRPLQRDKCRPLHLHDRHGKNRTHRSANGVERNEIASLKMLRVRLSLMFGIDLSADEVASLGLFDE